MTFSAAPDHDKPVSLLVRPYSQPSPVVVGEPGVLSATSAVGPRAVPPFIPAPWRAAVFEAEAHFGHVADGPAGLPAAAAVVALVEAAQPALPTSTGDDISRLPWIEKFLSSTPAIGSAVIPQWEPTEQGTVDVAADAVAGTAPELLDSTDEWAGAIGSHADAEAETDGRTDASAHAVTDAYPVEASLPMSAPVVPSVRIADEGVAPGDATETVAGDAVVEAEASPAADDAELAARENWLLDDAGVRMGSLAEEIRDLQRDRTHREVAELFDAPALPESLPMWEDDDMLDIMPLSHPLRPASTEHPLAANEPWAAMARREVPSEAPNEDGIDVPMSSHEAAARALEVLARRVREGELPLPGYDPGRGDAAAVAAALAALLGARR